MKEMIEELSKDVIVYKTASETNGRALYSMARSFCHEVDRIIEIWKNPNGDIHQLKVPESARVNQLGVRLLNSSTWEGITPGKENEFQQSLIELKEVLHDLVQHKSSLK